MPTAIAPPPLQTPIVELGRGVGVTPGSMTKVFADWLRSLVDRAQVAAFAVSRVPLVTQSASIATTDLIPLAAGLYRVSYRFRIVTPAGASSSLQFVLTTTEGGVTCTYESAAYTGNVNDRPQSGAFIVNADAGTPIAYQFVYTSNPGAAMVYEANVIAEAL